MAVNNIMIENAQIRFRNFSGKAGKFNPEGRRNFCVLLEDPKIVQMMEEDGWNVRYLQPRDDGEEPQPYIQVAVSFENTPPKIVLITSGGKTILEENDVNILDWAEIESVDLTIRPYNWTMSGRSGVKGYLKNMYVTIVEDAFENKYRDVPASAMNSIGSDPDEF